MPNWPSQLQPYPLVEGYQEAPPSTAIRTEMDNGPAKQRQRYTAAPRKIPAASVILPSNADLDVFDAFYTTTLQGGVLPFDWQDRNGTTKSFRFVAGDDAVVYEAIEPGKWRVRMKLEIMP